MQFFQCGIPSRGTLRYPLALECGPRIPVPEAIECREELRDDDTISAIHSDAQEGQPDRIQGKPSKLETTKTYDSLDDYLSPFEKDMALDRTAVYAQHDADINSQLREILDFRNQAASVKASVEKAAERFGNPTCRLARKSRKQQDLSRIVEDREATSQRRESPNIRIFCKLQHSERFKVFCFPRNGKCLVQLLRGVEEKLMLGLKADRPGRLLLVVNSRASFADDFVEIDDIASIRDEDRFIFLPFFPEERCKSYQAFEQLDLNYSTSEVASPPKPTRKMVVEKVPYNAAEYNATCARFSKHAHHYPSEDLPSLTKTPKMRNEFEWLQDQNMTGRTSTMSTVTSYTNPLDDTLCSESMGDDNREEISPTTTPFHWSLDENEWDESPQQDATFRHHANDLHTGERAHDYEMREGPPECTSHVLSPSARLHDFRGIDAMLIEHDLKKNRFAESMTKEFERVQGPSTVRGFYDRYSQVKIDEVESDCDSLRQNHDSNHIREYEEAFYGFPSSVECESPYETSRSRSLRRSEKVERRRRCLPRSPLRGSNPGRSRSDVEIQD